MKWKLHIVAFLITCFASAQVTFEAKVSKKKLGVNERLRIDFVMNKDGDNFTPPSFENFTIVGGPSQTISTQWLNGVKKSSKTFSYFLAPKKRGKFTIAQSTIEIDGEIYKTVPVTIEVTAAIDKPKDPNDPNYIASQSIHLVAEVSKTNPYLNEAITVVYKLYISPNTGVETWREVDNPRYTDFWSQNINVKELKLVPSKYNGEDYRYVVLRKTVLYPQKTGKLNIEPLTLDVKVQVPTNRRDIFGSRLVKMVNRTVAAGSRTINVKPLPEAGKPLDFSGAVGSFDFEVSTNKSELKATEALQATVKVSGKGNLKLFELPKLTLPSSLEVYEPEHSEKVSTNLTGMQGQITDNYTIVPSFQGKYPVPSVSFSYFDLKTKSYKTITSKEIVINVNEGPINNIENNTSTLTKQPITQSGGQFLSFKTTTNFTPIESSYFFKSKLFWTLLLVPFLAIPLAIFLRHKKEERDSDVVGNKVRTANKLAKKYLGEAKKTLGNKEAFYNAMERALHNYLKSKLHIETSDFSKDKIEELLTNKSVNNSVVIEFIDLLKSCELARYTPFSNVEMQQDYSKAARVISIIDKQIKR
ncbi:BatD family protein [Flavobacteriaceae bacterium S0825]|uniref:BatD family protein n=1 Tax=Gaetbulibacter sp. S0825 TaxID=2720084 RepID=UPI0014301114|nr:BatD family protein [Gaetbulibacter sp. S0825]MCK0108146.1 BatD family protein [Flavobacteriaceae bacterium S0825]NIX63782.1 protein BatD [Gaetbulibacter sp. S0825]